jgi:hypothetical protein
MILRDTIDSIPTGGRTYGCNVGAQLPLLAPAVPVVVARPAGAATVWYLVPHWLPVLPPPYRSGAGAATELAELVVLVLPLAVLPHTGTRRCWHRTRCWRYCTGASAGAGAGVGAGGNGASAATAGTVLPAGGTVLPLVLALVLVVPLGTGALLY